MKTVQRLMQAIALSMAAMLVWGSSLCYAQTNEDIVQEALSYITTWNTNRVGNGTQFYPADYPQYPPELVGECKWFIQRVVRAVGGELGTGYIGCYSQNGWHEIASNELVPGDIGQISQVNRDEAFFTGMHTWIVLGVYAEGSLWVVDSNIQIDKTPRVHDNYNPWNTSQVQSGQLAVHFYRLGNNVVLGHEENGTRRQAFLIAHNRNDGFRFVGYPYDDSSGPYVHSWQPHNFLVQNFSGGSWGACVIVMRETWTKAYPLHGAFWWRFWYYNVPNGLPISDEYASGNDIYQDFEDGKTYHWNLTWDPSHAVEVLDTSEVHATVGISLTQLFQAYALSSTEIYVSSYWVPNAVAYQVYRDGSYVGNLNSNLEFTDSGLTPETAYTYYVVALDSQGNILDQTDSVPVITLSTPTPDIPLVELVYWIRGSQIEVLTPTYAGASYCQVYLDGTPYQFGLGTSAFLNNVSTGSHTLQVKVFDSSDTLLAQSLTVTVKAGMLVSVSAAGPLILQPEESGEVVFTVRNEVKTLLPF